MSTGQLPTPAPATIRRSTPLPSSMRWALVALLVAIIVFSFLTHRENAHEKLFARVTEAVQRNDMSPVAKDFNAVQREQLTRGSVGRLSDQLAPLGKLKNVRETTPKDASARHFTFDVAFEKATWKGFMILDEDGKITSFYLRPPSGNAQ
ncbi:MAG: hypothetical protein JO140_01175 [Candidatus Eremiobacteraeota bacterium]|nr:hypothetical protein [Candidatus Eremiobacteraeota bacterium]